MNIEINAQNKTLGRVATEAAMALMGKNLPTYEPNKVADTKVHIINASKVKLSGKKIDTKKYKSFSGYPSGLKETKIRKVIAEKGYEEIFEKAILRMMPANRLRSKAMKNLKISN